MNFRDWESVRSGAKTQTRRIKGEGECLVVRDGAKTVLTRWDRVKWQVGRTYAVVPGMYKHSVGRFELLDIREERVQDISAEDAKAEGVPFLLGYVAEFGLLWNTIWKRRPDFQWEANPEVWALTIRWVD